jgi:hypothetical protein
LTPPELEALERAEPALVRAATDEPEKFLAGLRSCGACELVARRQARVSQNWKRRCCECCPRKTNAGAKDEVSPALAAPYFERIEEVTER